MKEENKKPFAVITGASQGLGKAFAIELAKRKYNVVLVSLPGQNLQGLSDQLRLQYNVESYYYETDFSSNENIKSLGKWLNANFDIGILINNAGIGGTRRFEEAHIDYLDAIIQVNVKATVILTRLLLPNLKRQLQSYILNVSSIAAFSPVGFKTVYPASKAFIYSFSRGLYAELKDTSVFVGVINPGPMATNPEVCSRIKKQGLIGKLTLLNPSKVACYTLTKLFRRSRIIPLNPVVWLLSSLIPVTIKVSLITQVVKKEMTYEENLCYRD